MIVDLVAATTSDGLRLDGALQEPAPERRAGGGAGRVDAVVCLHGVGSSFYGSSLFADLSARLVERGIAVLRANTRGHDLAFVTATPEGAKRCGAAYEIVDDCRHDVAAWIEALRQRGYQRIGVVGHSLGAIKALYSQAHAPHPAVTCVVAASAPRLSSQAFLAADDGRYRAALQTAEDHVKRGQPQTLIEIQFPFPLLITAAGYLDKYGPGERYNVLRFVDRIACPMLLVYGENELQHGGIAFTGLPDALRAICPEKSLTLHTVAGADHQYSGVRDRFCVAVGEWLTSGN